MLIQLSANKDVFVPIDFESGLNVILADRTEEASKTDSRNARGKSSLLSAINYCLGGNFPSEFGALAEDNWEFRLTLMLDGATIAVSRNCASPRNRVNIHHLSGEVPAWLSLLEEGGLRIETWKQVLGWKLFGLPDEADDDGARLSSRTLLTYLVRRTAPDDPTKIMAQQPARSSRVHTAYLLGLDWQVTNQLADLKDEQQVYKAIDTAASSKFLSSTVGNEADLLIERQEAILARDRVAQEARDFVLLDDPDDLITQADQLTVEVNSLRNEAFMIRQMVTLHESSLDESTQSAADETLTMLRAEMTSAFKAEALARLDEVEAFHNRIYENRVGYLGKELTDLRGRLADYERQLGVSLGRRTNILSQISAGGVLDELFALQRSHVELEAHVRDLDLQIDALRRWDRAREELNVTKGELRVQASESLNERQPEVDRFASRFDSLIRSLYGRGGALTVKVDEDGYKVTLKVPASASTGVSKMKLFSYDLTLLAESEPRVHPKFLIHDSVVFDGVDTVQTQTALETVESLVTAPENSNFQYIVMLNSNEVPEALSDSDWFLNGIRRRILETEVGGAFGVIF
ncbi:hypothetical protein AS189_09725 [Arthrobacter alpinus]|uniref:DUF2326 domain-containing protein n=1 Tax=Arthrobacter alpinus TaxID=656366 RepID=A0A0S2LZQ7_9MICC|nr:DUF2326 domain-containing protein [Arthrobacter alpinus]ALO66728.1 hypothetical protein AS189_09725 [Arthrobacter alpinus]